MNLTPHPITLHGEDGAMLEIPPTGEPARLEEYRQPLGSLEVGATRIPVVAKGLSNITGLPKPQAGVFYIVSLAVAQAIPEHPARDDVLVVDELVRDAAGRVIGARALARVVV